MFEVKGGGRANRVSKINRIPAIYGVMELMESRRLATATVSSWSSTSLSDATSGATYFAGVAVGDNGYPNGLPTAVAGAGGQQTLGLSTAWDGDEDDGFDSTLVGMQFSVNTSGTGGSSFEVADSGSSSLAFGGSAIHQVTIQADVAGSDMEMSFEDITVSFYRGGTLIETVSAGNLDANTMGATSWNPAESGLTVTAGADSSYDGVEISAQVRLQAAQGMYPGPSDIFGQIAIT
ncbi:MAG TPA: hypothetical protein VFE58_01615 [Tepidisphaeraceae bacterium]|jgi:hypothetical protein|nr:hypothetical protein [Tepidisphaeraceae bacterium]